MLQARMEITSENTLQLASYRMPCYQDLVAKTFDIRYVRAALRAARVRSTEI